MSRLEKEIWRACADLGLHADIGFRLVMSDQHEIETVARIADLGAPNGMLVVSSYDAVKNLAKMLADAGYGFSVLDEPDAREDYDVESFKVMFRDWGWAGELGKKPDWMR